MLIYLHVQNAQAVMNEWRARLTKGTDSYLKSIEDGNEALTFWSTHEHQGSGGDMNTKHIGVSIYYGSQK